MGQSRLEWRVGLFALICLVLLGALLVVLSKGVTRFARTYEINLITSNVGGIKPGASVLMAGYPIGNVAALMLSSNGEYVKMTLKIKQEHHIRTNAVFVLEQAGFLGDQYVAVYPSTNTAAPFFEDGAQAACKPPFNLQQTARDASGFIKRIDETAQKLNDAINDVRRLVLNEQTLGNLSNTVANARIASEQARAAFDNINALLETNGPMVSLSVSNVVSLSDQLNQFGGVLATNGEEITKAVNNIESSTVVMKNLFDDMQAGKGLAGTLLKNDMLATNVAAIAGNLAITTSNLNEHGLWGILWAKHTYHTTNDSSVRVLQSPRGASQ